MGRILDHIGVALLWRYGAHGLMLGLCLANEARPAPALPDRVLDALPYVQWVARHNYHLWIALYFPPALWLWRRDRAAFVHFLYVGGLMSLVRGITVPLTGLGPTLGPDLNAGLDGATLWAAWLDVINPVSALVGDAAHVHLTKDLFFSGHTATTFLLWLYCRGRGALGHAALLGHVGVVAVVFLSRLHYTIDVVGAWAITFTVFTLVDRRWPVATTFAARAP
ncbi:MAG: hypothetical protein H6702_25790 [Myxococcales bacterium]|nr:hypothetical protein [Myxococcales bacterium]